MARLRRMRPMMGTFVEIGVDEYASGIHLSAVDRAFSIVSCIDKLMSFHQPHSELTQINQSVGHWVSVSELTYEVLSLAKQMMYQTEHGFNCTVGGAMVTEGMLPNHTFQPFLPGGVADDIELSAGRVRLKRNVLITLDGIAKGYAIDKAVESLQTDGIQSGWVNAGGDLRVFGEVVMPIHRRESDRQLSYIGHQKNTAIATSSAEAGFDASLPGMMVDSRYQFKTGVWSVKAPQAWLADALTKVVACLPAEKVTRLLPIFSAELVNGLSIK